jgi:predicted transcriptional regulator of viral defense system
MVHTRQAGRPISSHLAPLVEILEMESPRIVRLDNIAYWMRELGYSEKPEAVVRQLQRNGWLLPLRTRGAWEFAPANRAGAISSGDPYIELRATLQRRSLDVALAYDSAAFVHGLSSRPPRREALAAPRRLKLPAALSAFRVARQKCRLPYADVNNLPVWQIATLLALMAATPTHFQDWSDVSEWLPEAFKRVDSSDLRRELDGANAQAWVRLAYLSDHAGFTRLAADLQAESPTPAGPIYLGPRNRKQRRYVAKYDLVDSVLKESVKS